MLLSRLRPTTTVRALVFLAGDLLIWGGSLWAALLIRFDGRLSAEYITSMPLLLLVLLPVKAAWHHHYRLYHVVWRAVGLRDLIALAKANFLALLTIGAVTWALRSIPAFEGVPRSVLLLDVILGACGVGAFRIARRGWQAQRGAFRSRRILPRTTRLLIYGAGAAGMRIAEAIEESGQETYHPVGFVDDDFAKQGSYINGLRVFGGRASLPRVVKEHRVEEVLIAIPSAHPAALREIIEAARQAGMLRIKVLPGLHEWLAGRDPLKAVREINPQDLLGRPPARIQYDALRTYLAGKRVLVTGGAGSIGSELVRQLSRFDVQQIIAVDMNETGLFELEQELNRESPHTRLATAISDVRDTTKINWLLRQTRPHLLFHAAGYKHVPMMERHVEEAVKANVFGTLTVAEAALHCEVETFVFISSDKAANPTSVMGATKRVGELIIHALGEKTDATRFLCVRFGNVLGSRGSIVPILQEQIRKGGPVTVTHPQMDRYFMTIAEAVLLVLQTPLLVTRGTLFMLDMGDPVRIVDLVRELISLSGLEADRDIPIVFPGVRPGENLHEDLVRPDERVLSTVFDRIFEVHTPRVINEATLRDTLNRLDRCVQVMDSKELRSMLTSLAHASAAEVLAVSG